MTDNLTAALAAVQAELPEIRKGETAEVETRTGRKYTYSYADLATVSKAVLPLLGKNGLAWITLPTFNDAGKFVLVYQLRHVSGEVLGGEYPLANGTPQEIGSAITYARRYTLCSVTGVAPEQDDDDAAAASHRAPAVARQDDWEQSRPARPQPTRDQVVEKALAAIRDASNLSTLGVLEKRVGEVLADGAIVEQDAQVLMAAIEVREVELTPRKAELEKATEPAEPAKPGETQPELVAAAFDQHKRGVHREGVEQ